MLDELDGETPWDDYFEGANTIQFVKRNNPPEKYPGNENAYPALWNLFWKGTGYTI